MIIIYLALFASLLFLTNYISYSFLKERIIARRNWQLNICSGKTDGGGLNVDIVKHAQLPNFIQIKDIYNLPFPDNNFDNVLCSHTMEHVEIPKKFYNELKRVGKNVKIVIPPLWDLSAAFNFLEHKWLFLTLKKEHSSLPPYIKLPLSRIFQKKFGQCIKA